MFFLRYSALQRAGSAGLAQLPSWPDLAHVVSLL